MAGCFETPAPVRWWPKNLQGEEEDPLTEWSCSRESGGFIPSVDRCNLEVRERRLETQEEVISGKSSLKRGY